MKQLYTILGALLIGSAAYGQCGPRYHEFMFASSVSSDIQYGQNDDVNGNNQNLTLDVYTPMGDTETSRPLVIIAHGGNFLGGSKTGADVVPLCEDLSKMGYVAASINYRLGMENFPFPGPDSADATEAVIRASHDAKASVRFFRESFENGNPYGIDTSLIFYAGVSAGGFMALNVAYFDDMAEYPTYIDTVNSSGLNGGIEGLSGSPGYSSNVRGIINLCGAIRDTAWMKVGDVPVLNFHGDQDGTVPFGSDEIVLLGAYPLLQVDGSESIAARADELGITNCFEIHEGEGHTPHVSDANYYDTTLNITRNFLVHFVCNDPLDCNYGASYLGIDEEVSYSPISIYPNPTNNQFTIDLDGNETASLIITDLQGRIVLQDEITGPSCTMNKPNVSSGAYFIRVKQGKHEYGGKIIFE